MSKFSLSAASAGKRPTETVSSSQVKKAPKVSQLKLEEPRLQQRTTSTNAPVNVCVYKVTDSAGDLWANFKDTDAKLFQIQMDHDARFLFFTYVKALTQRVRCEL